MIDQDVLNQAYLVLNKLYDERTKERNKGSDNSIFFSGRYYALKLTYHGLSGFIKEYEKGFLRAEILMQYVNSVNID